MAIVIGIPFLLLCMGIVLGTPLAHYASRDRHYETTQGQPDAIRLRTWYEQ